MGCNDAMGLILARVLELKMGKIDIQQPDEEMGFELSSSLLFPSVRAGIQADAVVDFDEDED